MKAQLTYLLEELSDDDRDRLIAKLKVHKSTYYRWVKAPGGIPYDSVVIVQAFLSNLHGEDYNMAALLKPVKIRA